MLRLCYSGLALFSVLGCSPVKDTANVPDAPIDGTDMRAPMIVSSNPADMSNKVSVLQPISVFVDEGLDPATVTAATVKLTYASTDPYVLFPFVDILRTHGPITGGPTPIRGTVSYDEVAHKISFVPALPLPYGTAFTLSMDVKDKAGLALTTQLSFMTYINAQTRQYGFNSVTSAPNNWISMPVDTAGRTTRRVQLTTAGTDQQWFSPDDLANSVYGFNYAADGRLIDERQYGQGTDTIYNTPDDPIQICVTYRYDAMKLNTERTYSSAAGPDAMFCTTDDVPQVNTVYSYTGTTMTGWVYFVNPGIDATWRTPDDRCNYYWDYAYDTAGRKTRDIMRSCGADNLARTTDDATAYIYYWDYEYDANGAITKQVWGGSAGTDNTWFTPDDSYNSYQRNQIDANGLITQTLESFGPGTDMVWGTSDDPGQRTVTTYNVQKLPEDVTTYTIGADNMWETADDTINAYTKLTYDVNGNRVDSKSYAAGADGLLKTADDRVVTDLDFDLSR